MVRSRRNWFSPRWLVTLQAWPVVIWLRRSTVRCFQATLSSKEQPHDIEGRFLKVDLRFTVVHHARRHWVISLGGTDCSLGLKVSKLHETVPLVQLLAINGVLTVFLSAAHHLDVCRGDGAINESSACESRRDNDSSDVVAGACLWKLWCGRGLC